MKGVTVKMRTGAALLLLTLCALTLTGMSGAARAVNKKAFDPTCGAARTATRTVNGTLGSITIHGTPTRIVALEFSFVDDLINIGVRPIGVADDNQPYGNGAIIPPIAKKLGQYTSVGLRASPNLESIAALHPDLIIADAQRDATIYNQLQAIAPTVALDSLKEPHQAALHAAVVVGQAVNKCGLMVQRVKQDKIIFQRLKNAVPKNFGDKAMFVVEDSKVWNDYTSQGYQPSLLQDLGIPNATPGEKGGPAFVQLTLEGLVNANPDVMFLADYSSPPSLYSQWKTNALWSAISAVKKNQVYVVNPQLWSRARGILAGEIIAQQAVHLLFHKYVSIALPKVTT
jgi:ABC-type Fe3+-citrate transport system substrate-binding protein